MRGFAITAIAIATDGSEDHFINVKGLPEYRPDTDKGKRIIDDEFTVQRLEQRELENEDFAEQLICNQLTTIRQQAKNDDKTTEPDYDD